MINFFRQWTVTIVTLVVLLTFLEIILPKSDLKKYINITSGFLLIIIILNPFIKLVNSDINIEKEVFKNIILNSESDFYITEDYKNFQENQTIELYENKIKRHIKKTIEDNFIYKVIEINIDIDIEREEQKKIGNIKKVYLVLSQKNTIEDNKNTNDKYSIKIEPISEIEVNLKSIEPKELKSDVRDNNRSDEIKTFISNNYKLPKESITIIYQ